LLDVVEHVFRYLLNVQRICEIRISKVYLSIHAYSKSFLYITLSTFFISLLSTYRHFPLFSLSHCLNHLWFCSFQKEFSNNLFRRLLRCGLIGGSWGDIERLVNWLDSTANSLLQKILNSGGYIDFMYRCFEFCFKGCYGHCTYLHHFRYICYRDSTTYHNHHNNYLC